MFTRTSLNMKIGGIAGNSILEQLWEGAQEIGNMVAAKQFKGNAVKSTILIQGHQRSRTDRKNSVEADPVMSPTHR